MALDPLYIVASDLESYFVDKDTGLPLANGTLSFYRDSARNVPKLVYQLTGAPPYSDDSYISMGYQITLSAVGTVQNSGGDNEVIYWYPYDEDGNLDLYYVVVANSAGTVQFTREAWPNGVGGGGSATAGGSQINQIANPTFTNVFLNPGITNTYTVGTVSPALFQLAPDWYFEIAGTGTVIVQQIAIAGDQNIIGSPPYVLDINVSAGISSCKLVQKFSVNSGLWSTSGGQSIYLYGAFVAQNMNSGTAPVIMSYEDGSASAVVIVNANVETPFSLQSGTTVAAIPLSSNATTGLDSYVTVYFSFSPATHIQLTCVQLIPLFSQFTGTLPTDIDSSNRNEAYQGDYYLPRAAAKQIDSFLTGWDFPVNPYQFGSSGSITTTAAYITDQTIAKAASTNDAFWGKDPVSGGIQFSNGGTPSTNDAFYIMQYLSSDQLKGMVGNRLSLNIFGYQNDSHVDNAVVMRAYLFCAPSSASIPTLPTTIGTIATTGIFTPTATDWVPIDRGGLPTPQVTLNKFTGFNGINSGKNDYGFSGWQLTNLQLTDTAHFAIVVTFACTNINSIFTINSISLTPGDLPSRPAIKSVSATLQDCKYYYQSSFLPGTAPARGLGLTHASLGVAVAAASIAQLSIIVNFNLPLRTAPLATSYNPILANNQMYNYTRSQDCSSTTPLPAAHFIAWEAVNSSSSVIGDVLAVCWTADARLGIV